MPRKHTAPVPKVRTTIELEPEVDEKLRAMADNWGVGLSAMIAHLVRGQRAVERPQEWVKKP